MQTKRHQILQSAINTVTQYGYRRTTMDDIAKDAGISRASIYQHFKNKEAVTLAAFDLVNEQSFSTARNATDGLDDPAQKLCAYVTAYMVFYFRLIFAGPHADEIMQMKSQLQSKTPKQAREQFVAEINQFFDLKANAETGQIIAAAAEGIKMAAPDEEVLRSRLALLLEKFTN